MTSVITGDIIKSRQANPETWITILKNALSFLSSDNSRWEIYRGDSFQIEITDISESFLAAVYLKACIKTIKGLDVRLAIGIGNKAYQGKDVTESNGEAFVFSGETLESLKKEKQNLRVKTSNTKFNVELNLYFKLALVTMDNWTVNSAEVIKLSIENPNALQQELAQLIGTKQDAISKRQKRAGLEHILELNQMYQLKITSL
ncbi:transcriptional regulator [Seonamhaeicola sediminis]|uniref:Transcriptional regulator n=1 Tax=Seonamhaeicola sediminis TaxID=2528206 RepID=A0A562YBK2_9FLAO|nr:transcriptional regulator [Seonamhaeicola sediminis]TWO31872.1 transcriptional regulator [Seonamhaeicola sediminis]